MIRFDSNNCELDGVYLVEASAGTGKTHNIQNLVIRLILEKDLEISQILVVTFTRAATAELSDRIRQILQSCCQFLSEKKYLETDPAKKEKTKREYELLFHAASGFQDNAVKDCIKKLREAILNFDDNAISTIDGFCQRMLSRNAFESGILFRTEVLEAGQATELTRELIRNQWRKICYETDSPYTPLFTGVVDLDHYFSGAAGKTGEDYVYSYEKIRRSDNSKPSLDRLIENPSIRFDAEASGRSKETVAESITETFRKLQELQEKLRPAGEPEDAPAVIFASGELNSRSGVRNLAERLRKEDDGHFCSVYEKNEELEQFLDLLHGLKKDLLDLKLTILQSIRNDCVKDLSRRKREENFQTFKDLQTRMIEALKNSEKLAQSLRKQFKAAVIDEFQDTDRVQYEIFTRVFAPGLESGKSDGIPLFLVGDPKQSIYGFRGGDIFAYERAARQIGPARTLSLDTNFRSADALVSAVNKIFSSHPLPFADRQIEFAEVHSSGKKTLLFDGAPDKTPFHYIAASDDDGIPPLKVCEEKICRLLTENVRVPEKSTPDSKEEDSSRPLLPSDIAVLVRSSYIADPLALALRKRGVPVSVDSETCIYDTQEARDVEKLLAAVYGCGSVSNVFMFMQTTLADGKHCRDLSVLSQDEIGKVIEETRRELSELKDVFSSRGVAEMFRSFMEKFGIHRRYPALQDGAGRYSRLLQLRDIFIREEKKGRHTLEMLLSWLRNQLRYETRTAGSDIVLLETDAPAVKIMTIHKSKGLQFPVVFLPDLADSPIKTEKCVTYHDPADPRNVLISTPGEPRTVYPVLESVQEELRIVYVALTRAARACYVCIPESTKKESAFSWLYCAKEISKEVDPKKIVDFFVQKEVKSQLKETLEEQGLIESVSLSAAVLSVPEKGELNCLSLDGVKIPSPSVKYSYTEAHGRFVRRKEQEQRSEEETPSEVDEGLPAEVPDAFSLPKGNLFGTGCHEVLEALDFQDPSALDSLIRRCLAPVNIRDKQPIAKAMLEQALSAPVKLFNGKTCTLSEIGWEDRCSEIEFDFRSSEGFDPVKIADAMNTRYKDRLERFGLEKLCPLKSSSEGETFYCGSADLIFRKDGRFYIVDWKTDYLNSDLRNFEPENLFVPMWNKFYLYQSLLYSAALIRFLSLRTGKTPQEVYGEMYGGVRYFFLRGVDASGRGIYSDLPPLDMINEIAEVK